MASNVRELIRKFEVKGRESEDERMRSERDEALKRVAYSAEVIRRRNADPAERDDERRVGSLEEGRVELKMGWETLMNRYRGRQEHNRQHWPPAGGLDDEVRPYGRGCVTSR